MPASHSGYIVRSRATNSEHTYRFQRSAERRAVLFFLQIRDENWGGEFLDVPEGMEIVDRSVFRLVQVTLFNINSRNVLSPVFVYVTLA